MPTLRTYRTDAKVLDTQIARLELLDGSAKSCDRFVVELLAEREHEQVRRAYVAAELAAFTA